MVTTTLREVMSSGVEVIRPEDSVISAARRMAQLDVGALPVCKENGELVGMITDRDIVVKAVASEMSPADVPVGSLASQPAVSVGADETPEQAAATMAEYQVRRLPVVDHGHIVGIVTQADLSRVLPLDAVGRMVEAISR